MAASRQPKQSSVCLSLIDDKLCLCFLPITPTCLLDVHVESVFLFFGCIFTGVKMHPKKTKTDSASHCKSYKTAKIKTLLIVAV